MGGLDVRLNGLGDQDSFFSTIQKNSNKEKLVREARPTTCPEEHC